MPSNDFYLFTDGSVDPSTGWGFGAYLVVPYSELASVSATHAVQVKRFEHTTSSQLELRTLLWALREIAPLSDHVTVCTDSQTIVGLPGRRARLEMNQFRSKQGRLLHHHAFYKEFFHAMDRYRCEFVKMRGHAPSDEQSDLDRRFAEVDRAARNALRQD